MLDEPIEPVVDEAAEAGAAREQAALRTARGQTHTTPKAMQPLPKVSDDASYEAIDAGASYTDPDGRTRVKPYRMELDSDYSNIPEGADYLDPTGQLRTKEKYEGLGFTAQTLYNMAVNDKERQKVLELYYPGKVRKTKGTNESYIEDDGVLRKPKGFTESPGAYLTGQAGPIIGSIAGEIGGGVLGSMAAPGPGTFGGAVAGGAAGGALGEGFNSLILQLTGAYDRDLGEQAAEMGTAAAFGGAGSAVGRGVAAIAPSVKNLGAKAVGKFLGADKEGLDTAIRLREQGTDLVPPSVWAKESPYLQNLAEVLDPAFRTQRPLDQAARKHYETSAGEVLKKLGVDIDSSLIEPTAAVPLKETGEAVIRRAVNESATADLELNNKIAAAKASREAGLGLKEAEQVGLQEAAENARKAADKLVNLGFQEIDHGVNQAMAVAKTGSGSGELWGKVAEKIRLEREGIQRRAVKLYDGADALAGNHTPNIGGLGESAQSLLSEVPIEFEQRYPALVRKLRDFGAAEGERETPMTFGQLHNLRSMLRDAADWYVLPSDVRNGSMKFLANKVDAVIHDMHAVPELKAAAKALDGADKFYRENMAVFNAKELNAVMSGLKAGEPADPQNLFNAMFKAGQSDLNAKIMNLIGPSLQGGVRAADVRAMLDASKTLGSEIDGKKFAAEVLDRHRNNMLHTIHGKEMGDKLFKQAQLVDAMRGKGDIPAVPGDTAWDIIRRARLTAEAAKAGADRDPLGMLKKDMIAMQRELSQRRATRQKDPLGFLYDPKIGAARAAENILNSEDLLLAAAARFGSKSPEFEMLRQTWVHRLLQGTMNPAERLKNISPEVQELMLPGMTLGDTQMLAKEMRALLDTKSARSDTGKSIMAQTRVMHPWSSLPGGKAVGTLIPGVSQLGRFIHTTYYKLVTNMANNLPLMRWIRKGLNGDETSRALAREAIQRAMQRGGAAGAGAGQEWAQSIKDFDGPEFEGARQSPKDGKFYVPDPDRPGKYLRVGQ